MSNGRTDASGPSECKHSVAYKTYRFEVKLPASSGTSGCFLEEGVAKGLRIHFGTHLEASRSFRHQAAINVLGAFGLCKTDGRPKN